MSVTVSFSAYLEIFANIFSDIKHLLKPYLRNLLRSTEFCHCKLFV